MYDEIRGICEKKHIIKMISTKHEEMIVAIPAPMIPNSGNPALPKIKQ